MQTVREYSVGSGLRGILGLIKSLLRRHLDSLLALDMFGFSLQPVSFDNLHSVEYQVVDNSFPLLGRIGIGSHMLVTRMVFHWLWQDPV